MWIRTQDRKRLVECNDIGAYGKNVIADINGDTQILGTYATEARALEVLDEIQKMVIGRVILPPSFTEKQIDEYLKNSFILPEIAFREPQIQQLPIVYEMPKE